MGSLIISYDCEGIWGMLDKLNSLDNNIFNRQSLIDVYKQIVKIHDEYNMNATFAFVGAFVSTREEFLNTLNEYDGAIALNNWYKPILETNCRFPEEDLHIPELLDIIKASTMEHEISSHGYSHVIMDKRLDAISLQAEISGIKSLMQNKNINISTIIFPRNIVNYQFLDKAEFITGYRAPPKSISSFRMTKRIYALLKEFIPFSRSEELTTYKNKLVIPGDFFINWRSGLRRFVPIWLTVFRFRMALNHACKNNGIVHIWLHPHNLLSGKKQIELLHRLLTLAENYRKKNLLKVLTQSDCVAKSIMK